MNNTRRKAIKEVIKKLEAMQEDLNILYEELETIRDEEEEAMENIPESLQETDRYYKAEEAVDNLNTVIDCFDSFDFDDILGSLENAIE